MEKRIRLRWNTSLTAAGALMATALLLGAVGGHPSDDSRSEETPTVERSYTVSSDPTAIILKTEFRGVQTGEVSGYTLYGDGRLTYKYVDRAGRVLGRGDTTLTFNRVKELLDLVIDRGLLDSDDAALQAHMWHQKRPGSFVDASILDLTLMVTAYSRAGADLGPASRRFRMQGVTAHHKQYPEIEELAGVVDLLHELEAIRHTQMQGQPP